jgi:hypothetical protein
VPVLLHTAHLFAVAVGGILHNGTVSEKTNIKSQSAITVLASFRGFVSTISVPVMELDVVVIYFQLNCGFNSKW